MADLLDELMDEVLEFLILLVETICSGCISSISALLSLRAFLIRVLRLLSRCFPPRISIVVAPAWVHSLWYGKARFLGMGTRSGVLGLGWKKL